MLRASHSLSLRFSRLCRQTNGWKRHALALAFGVLAALAMPPVFAFPLWIVALCGLTLLLRSAETARRACLDGFFFGWGFFIAGTYWIGISLFVDPDRFAWMLPFALFGLTAALALFHTLAAYLAWRLAKSAASCLSMPLSLTLALTFTEYLRGHLFTGFPWNLPGYVFAFSTATLQGASVIGIYGLSWLALLLGTVPAALINAKTPSRAALRTNAALWAIFACLTLWGIWRAADAGSDENRNIPVMRIVQPNIDQRMRDDPKQLGDVLQLQLALSRAKGVENITHIIWPESAVPVALYANSPVVRLLSQAAPPYGLLLTGALRAEGEGKSWQAWNSLIALSKKDGAVSYYDKHHLVPFGEFVPLRGILPLEKITAGIGDFSRGPGPETMQLAGTPPFLPLICYEAIFPQDAFSSSARPEWLLNITNDAWFGNSSGPYQHLHMSRVRAIEQGLPLIRAANTGISAVIDAKGHILDSLPLNTTGVIDHPLPSALPATIYSQICDLIPVLLWSLNIVFLYITMRSRKS